MWERNDPFVPPEGRADGRLKYDHDSLCPVHSGVWGMSGRYVDNGNLLWHTDSVMGTWNFNYDAVDGW